MQFLIVFFVHNRRKFIKSSALLLGMGLLDWKQSLSENLSLKPNMTPINQNLLISTWDFGLAANQEGAKILENGGSALDAVEAGAKVPEADPLINSVGKGGLPDEIGKVSLDACIMDEKGNCGSVMFLEHILHPVSVAKLVMTDTPHVYLAGEGALQFALSKGFKKENLLTETAKKDYEKWKDEHKALKIDKNNHDTIGILGMDSKGNLSGACTTSGLAWKMHGRVGDSPIIGAGLYVDNEVGAATATGKGEAMVKVCASFLIVELMRNGKSPQEAVEITMKRIIDKNPDYKDFQVGLLAINKKGEHGAYGLHVNFKYALYKYGKHEVLDADYYNK